MSRPVERDTWQGALARSDRLAELQRLLHVFGERRTALLDAKGSSMDVLHAIEELEAEYANLIIEGE